MKTKPFLFAFLFLAVALFADEATIKSAGWYYENGIILKGKLDVLQKVC